MTAALLILLIVCQVLTPLLLVLMVRRWIRRSVLTVQDQATAELLKLVNGEPCQLASVLNAAGRVIGSEAGRSVKASLMADLSHQARAQNQADADLQLSMLDQAAGSGGLGGALLSLPINKRSKIMRHPLAQMAVQLLANSGGGSGPANNGDHTAGSVRDRLKKGA